MAKNQTVWLSASSLHSWNDPSMWDQYFQEIDVIFGDSLAKLDENDLARRKAGSTSEDGRYITKFNESQGGKVLFGEFSKKTDIRFTVEIYKSPVDIYGRHTMNRITFYIPVKDTASLESFERIRRLFNLTIGKLSAFLAESDLTEEIYKKKSHDTYGLDISIELLGIFWLTFFGKSYTEFFTRDKLSLISGYQSGPLDGVTLRLAACPSDIKESARREAESLLGERLFAGFEPITDFNMRKLPGLLPTLEELRGYKPITGYRDT